MLCREMNRRSMVGVLFVPLLLWAYVTAGASAQNPQTTVDIALSALVFDKGVVKATVRRNDPPNQAPASVVRVRVTFAVRGQKPFHTAAVSLKPGTSLLVAAPYPGSGSRITFSATAMPIGLKEIRVSDNSLESIPYSFAATVRSLPGRRPVAPPSIPLPGERQPPLPKPGAIPNRLPVPSPNPAPPAPPAPAPAPAPATAPAPAPPPAAPPFATISTPELVVIGGELRTPTVGVSTGGARLTTPGLVLIGGVQGKPSVGSTGTIKIATPPLVLIGRKE